MLPSSPKLGNYWLQFRLLFLLCQNLKGKGKGEISSMILKYHPLIVSHSPIQRCSICKWMQISSPSWGQQLWAGGGQANEHRSKWNACPLQVWSVLERCRVMDIKILGCILGATGDREGLCTNELLCWGERNMHSGVGLNSGRVGILGWEMEFWKASDLIFDSWFPLVNQPPFWSISWGS